MAAELFASTAVDTAPELGDLRGHAHGRYGRPASDSAESSALAARILMHRPACSLSLPVEHARRAAAPIVHVTRGRICVWASVVADPGCGCPGLGGVFGRVAGRWACSRGTSMPGLACWCGCGVVGCRWLWRCRGGGEAGEGLAVLPAGFGGKPDCGAAGVVVLAGVPGGDDALVAGGSINGAEGAFGTGAPTVGAPVCLGQVTGVTSSFPYCYGGGPDCTGLAPAQTNSVYGPHYTPKLTNIEVDGSPLNPARPAAPASWRPRATPATPRWTPTSR